MTRTMKPGMPKVSREWMKGPRLTAPAEELVAWLDAQKRGDEPRLVRVVLVLSRGDAGFSTSRVRIGALEVDITDYALGVGLRDRTHRAVGDTCAFLSEGYWRDGTFDLRDTSQRPLAPEELAAFTHLEVEGETAN